MIEIASSVENFKQSSKTSSTIPFKIKFGYCTSLHFSPLKGSICVFFISISHHFHFHFTNFYIVLPFIYLPIFIFCSKYNCCLLQFFKNMILPCIASNTILLRLKSNNSLILQKILLIWILSKNVVCIRVDTLCFNSSRYLQFFKLSYLPKRK